MSKTPRVQIVGRIPSDLSRRVRALIGAIAHRLCRLIWKILRQGIRDEERGPAVTKHRMQRRAAKMIRELRSLGYRVERGPAPASTLA